MHLTWLDNNSWLIEIGSQKILLDPWLVGDLTFNNADWFFKGSRQQDPPIPENIDLILLSQGIEDHTHPPTLKQLDHNIKVVASPTAVKVVEKLGYNQITALTQGETFTLNQQVEITAFPGTSMGPTVLENAYLLKELESGLTIYYEPHGNHSPQIKQLAPVDIVITPIIDFGLPLIGSIIKGGNTALEVAKCLQPQIILPTALARDVLYEGFLTKFLRATGSVTEFRVLLEKNNVATQVFDPQPGIRFEMPLEKRELAKL
ncbi:hypothetical protein NIES4074_27850 [Cylindrospermum sp. NIES-4074]|nr:hypothetical protein NIES4074_27850 [Cylindrospermum sp. NIES-4074]